MGLSRGWSSFFSARSPGNRQNVGRQTAASLFKEGSDFKGN